MAAPSPVTIESSPTYEAYQAPSITPESSRRSLSAASIARSSPQLLSPSAFVRPRPQPLKSGSRVQQVPAGAQAGFASAASLWKLQKDDANWTLEQQNEAEEALAGRREDGEGTKKKKSTGKLTRPRKAPRPRKPSVTPTKASDSSRFDSFVQTKEDTAALPEGKLGQAEPNTAEALRDTIASHRPSVNISEYSFNADAVPAESDVLAKATTSAKKATRKRSTRVNVTGNAPAKEARTSKAKSEAIILDSDEPDVMLAEVLGPEKEGASFVSKPSANKPRPKTPHKPTDKKIRGNNTSMEASKTTKKRQDVEKPNDDTTEKFTYFAQPPVTDTDRLHSSPPPAPFRAATNSVPHHNAFTEHTGPNDLVDDISLLLAEPAPRRRRSWTPVKNSLAAADNETNTIPVVNYELDENMGQVPFSEMLGNFSYSPDEAAKVKRLVSGDMGTKRRRVEVSEMHIPEQLQLGPQDAPKAKAPSKPAKSAKKPKAAPKKPQTITSLAMAPYQPPKELDVAQSTVSAFFTPREEVEVAPVVEGNLGAEQPPAKVKKPRKSRAKAPPEDGAIAHSKKPAKPKTKTTKVKAKFNEKDHQPPLYSPTKATKQMKSQDFLFGTSSQLATEESPEFIREIQLAVCQSEMVCAMPRSSQIGTQFEQNQMDDEKSCAKVPTAPHGTSLSLGQANRELWCDGARDTSGSKLAQGVRDVVDESHPEASPEVTAQFTDTIAVSSPMGLGQEKVMPVPRDVPAFLDPLPEPAAFETPQDAKDEEAALHALPDASMAAQTATEEADQTPPENDWVLLQSDDSIQPAGFEAPQRSSAAVSPAKRTVLQALDANIALSMHYTASKPHTLSDARSFSTTVPLAERDRMRKSASTVALDAATNLSTSPKRGRGRPRKDGSPTRPIQTSPVRGPGRPRKISTADKDTKTSPVRDRGRPPKDGLSAGTPSMSPKRPVGRPRKKSNTSMVLVSPKRPVGRPRKNSLTTIVDPTSPKRPVGRPRKQVATTISSPQKVRKDNSCLHSKSASQPTIQDKWTKIDEISDSDSPATPSPRRRRASSSPAFIRPLDFERPQSPSAKPKATASSTTAIKPTDAAWPAVQAKVFPKIADAIKSAPTSEDVGTPSWHEKILLYDPIVLEDLTAWLNEQGLRIEFERIKPKIKTKGRRKKDAPLEVDEWETVRDEVKPWMVQKWCEDNSICCLWKEGLRGGVKARY